MNVDNSVEVHRVLKINRHLISPGRILDIGCNEGDTAIYLVQEGRGQYTIDALDKSRDNLEVLEERIRGRDLPITLHEGDITEFKLPANTFSAICAFLVLQFFDTTAPRLESGRFPTLLETQHQRIIDALVPGGVFLCKLLAKTQYRDGSFEPLHAFPLNANEVHALLAPLDNVQSARYFDLKGWHVDQGVHEQHRHFCYEFVGRKK